MKDKGGKQVPNCVPNESVVKEISGRTPKIFVKTAAVEKKIKELMADRKKAVVPYNKETDPKKKEILKQILIKLTNQIKDCLNLIIPMVEGSDYRKINKVKLKIKSPIVSGTLPLRTIPNLIQQS
jgi:hypothetical protein